MTDAKGAEVARDNILKVLSDEEVARSVLPRPRPG